jgi:antitoxin component YwqK of YwqJK toxin-antitoxin module
MRRCFLPAILLLIGLHGFAEELLYKSTDFGMLLAPLPPYLKDESRWILRIQRNGPNEDRRLFDNGKEVRRWQITWNRQKTEKVERESAGGTLAARRVYDAEGSLLQEEEYRAGVLSKKIFCTYAKGRLARKRELGGDGKVISSVDYLYAINGGLREVRRTLAPGATNVASVVSGPSGLSEERSSMNGGLFVERFGMDGRLVNRERRVDGDTLFVEDFAYDSSSGVLASSQERLPTENKVIDRRYDSAGRLSQETTSIKGDVTETDAYEHDEKGRVTMKLRRSSVGLESWKSIYSDSGDLSREEYSQRGILVKAVIHGKGKLRTEELYRDGELFLKVFFDGDTRLREEVWSNGSLQRERSYP